MIPITKVSLDKAEIKNLLEVVESGMLAQGKKTQELEELFAEYCGTKHAIAVSSGTAALHAALYAAGIRNDDEVITTPFTFVATANPIVMQNGKVIFADIDESTFNIDPKEVEKKITKKTKAIIAVDLYGQPADYTQLKKISEKYGLTIIQDAAQSHAAQYKNTMSGSHGDMGCFSFYATKNMMCGEGGMITTSNDLYAEQCRRFRHHGQSQQTRYEYHDIGYNYRITDLQSAIALAQLKKLDMLTNKRIQNAKTLTQGIKNIEGITPPSHPEYKKHVYHQYTIKCDNKKVKRDDLFQYLRENNIGAGKYYPKPLHLHPHFQNMGYKKNDYPISERISTQVISLPVHPYLTKEELEHIISVLHAYAKKT